MSGIYGLTEIKYTLSNRVPLLRTLLGIHQWEVMESFVLLARLLLQLLLA